ncbi:MAG: hypothetical protein K0S27_1152 [Gammaproteobacteria bacterium]|jgi:hypothetical protein|nr:hypothetical protein [Gammaproteobacteria bacterium]
MRVLGTEATLPPIIAPNAAPPNPATPQDTISTIATIIKPSWRTRFARRLYNGYDRFFRSPASYLFFQTQCFTLLDTQHYFFLPPGDE